MFHVKNNDSIQLNCSKSLLIRQLIAHFLYRNELLTIGEHDSCDVQVVYNCLKQIQLHRSISEPIYVNVGDCGAGFRFLLAVLSVTSGEWLLTGSTRLRQRPIAPLVHTLRSLGADIQEVADGWRIRGYDWHATQATIDCSQSSQFASALWLIAPRVGLQQIQTIPETPFSAPYIAMTQQVVEAARGQQHLHREADWSTAAFWYAFLLLSPIVNCLVLNDLHLATIQGDRAVANIFQKWGISSEQQEDGVRICKSSMVLPPKTAMQLDLSATPDLAPVVAVAAVCSSKSLLIKGLDNLNRKESDRLSNLAQSLNRFAEVAEVAGNQLTIRPRVPSSKIVDTIYLDTHHDHRLVMAYSLLSLKYRIQLSDLSCVAKSYPDFTTYFSLDNLC